MSRNANDAIVNPVVPSLVIEGVLQAVDANSASDNRVTNIELDRGVSSWSVADYYTRYVDTLFARRFGAIFSYGANSFMFDRRVASRDTDISAWNRRWMFLTRWCLVRLKNVFGLDMPIVRHTKEVGYLHHSLRPVQNVDVTSEYRGFDFRCFVDPIDGSYIVEDAVAW